jgi:hypothetical protein
VPAKFCTSLMGWVTVLQARIKSTSMVNDRNLVRRVIEISFSLAIIIDAARSLKGPGVLPKGDDLS